jgi:dihydroxyacetone synthase
MMFIKPRTALIGPSPGPIKIPHFMQDDSSDYEAELAVILSRSGRNIPEASAMDYVLGYTCSNDVSARRGQFKNSQVSFSKGRRECSLFLSCHSFTHNFCDSFWLSNHARSGLGSSCPFGPVLVFKEAVKNPDNLRIKALYNREVVQDFKTQYGPSC